MSAALVGGGDARGDLLRLPQFRLRDVPRAALHRQFTDHAMCRGEGEEIVMRRRLLSGGRRARQRAGRLPARAVEGGPGEVMLRDGGDVDTPREERRALIQRLLRRHQLMVGERQLGEEIEGADMQMVRQRPIRAGRRQLPPDAGRYRPPRAPRRARTARRRPPIPPGAGRWWVADRAGCVDSCRARSQSPCKKAQYAGRNHPAASGTPTCARPRSAISPCWRTRSASNSARSAKKGEADGEERDGRACCLPGRDYRVRVGLRGRAASGGMRPRALPSAACAWPVKKRRS